MFFLTIDECLEDISVEHVKEACVIYGTVR